MPSHLPPLACCRARRPWQACYREQAFAAHPSGSHFFEVGPLKRVLGVRVGSSRRDLAGYGNQPHFQRTFRGPVGRRRLNTGAWPHRAKVLDHPFDVEIGTAGLQRHGDRRVRVVRPSFSAVHQTAASFLKSTFRLVSGGVSSGVASCLTASGYGIGKQSFRCCRTSTARPQFRPI